MTRNWVDGSAPYLSAANLNAMESDITTALGVPDGALASRINDPNSQSAAALNATIAAQLITVLPSGDTTGATDWTKVNAQLALGPVRLISGGIYYFNKTLIGKRIYAAGAELNFTEPSGKAPLFQNPAYVTPAAQATDAQAAAGSNVITTSLASVAKIGQTIVVNGVGNGGNGPLTGIVSAIGSGTITVAKHDGTVNPAQFLTLSQRISAKNGAITALPIAQLRYAVGAGSVTLTNGPLAWTVTTTGAAVNATSLPITSATAPGEFGIDTQITAPASLTGLTVRLHDRDQVIDIQGGAWISTATTIPGEGRNIMVFHADDVHIDIEKGRSTVGKFFVAVGDLRNYWIRALNLNVASDGVDLQGPMWKGHVDRVDGYTHDDSLSLLCANSYGSGFTANAYNTSGDIMDLTIGNVSTDTACNNFKVIAGAGNRVGKIKVLGSISGTSGIHSAWIGDDSISPHLSGGEYGHIETGTITSTPPSTGASLSLANCNAKYIRATLGRRGTSSGRAVLFNNGRNMGPSIIDTFEVDGTVDFSQITANPAQGVIYMSNAGGTVRSFRERIDYMASPVYGGVFLVGSGGTVDDYVHESGRWVWVPALKGNGLAITGVTMSRITFSGGTIESCNAILRDATLTPDVTLTLTGGVTIAGSGNVLSAQTAGTRRLLFGECTITGQVASTVYVKDATIVFGGGATTQLPGGSVTIQRNATETISALPGCRLPLPLGTLTGAQGSEAIGTSGLLAGVPATTTAAGQWRPLIAPYDGLVQLVAGSAAVALPAMTASGQVSIVRTSGGGGTMGHLAVANNAGTGFTITSTSGTDTSWINWTANPG